MMRKCKRICVIFIILLLAGTTGLYAQSVDNNVQKGFASITLTDLKARLTFLGSDAMEGRETGHTCSFVTSEYIKSEFTRIGLIPIGDNGYFQTVPMRKGGLDEEHAFGRADINGKMVSLKLYEDYLPAIGEVPDNLPVVFAGYGLELPNYNSYAGLDVKGKIVLVFSHYPGEQVTDIFPQEVDDLSMRWYRPDHPKGGLYYKSEIAKKLGAAGIVMIENPGKSHFRSFSKIAQSYKMVSQGHAVQLVGDNEPEEFPSALISQELAEKLFAADSLDLMAVHKKIISGGKPVTAVFKHSTLSFSKGKTIISERNVVGMIKGTDPALSTEYIVLGGHFDHVGIQNGQVMNGADDNASGTVGVIEIAEAFSVNPVKPKRSVIFIGFTGEEKGLLGSTYYVNHPVKPLAQTVAMFNLDMISRDEDTKNMNKMYRSAFGLKPPFKDAKENDNVLNIIGTVRSPDMRNIVEKWNAVSKLDLVYAYDKTYFFRASDHFPFLQKKIPVVFFNTGPHADLHQPTDDIEKIDFGKMNRICQLVYLSMWQAANEPGKPAYTDEETGEKK